MTQCNRLIKTLHSLRKTSLAHKKSQKSNARTIIIMCFPWAFCNQRLDLASLAHVHDIHAKIKEHTTKRLPTQASSYHGARSSHDNAKFRTCSRMHTIIISSTDRLATIHRIQGTTFELRAQAPLYLDRLCRASLFHKSVASHFLSSTSHLQSSYTKTCVFTFSSL